MDKVVVIGASNMDVIAKSNEAIIAGESNIGSISKAPGGVGRNIAFALKALGFDVSILTAVADDQYGKAIAKGLEAEGISMVLPPFDSSECSTGVYLCIFDSDGSLNVAVNDMKINEKLNAKVIEDNRALLESADYVVFEANLDTQTIKAISNLGVKLVADCVSSLKAPRLAESLESLYLLKANFTEACTLAGLEGIEPDNDGLDSVMQALVAKGLRRAIISLGKNGAFCYEVTGTGTRGYDAKIMPNLNVVSVNGCGDVLLSGFLRALSEDMDLYEALLHGMAASGINAESMEAVSKELNFEKVKIKVEENYEQIS